jgi:hypothetical protein
MVMITTGWLLAERDDTIARLPVNPIPGAYPTVSRLDSRFWSWNFNTHAWEVADASANLGGLCPAQIGASGPELSMVPRQIQRLQIPTTNATIFLFKMSFNGASSDYRAPGCPATFDVTPFTRGTSRIGGVTSAASVTCSSTSNPTFTGAAGTFNDFRAGEWTEISGGSANIGAVGGGNNTLPLQPVFILAVAANGSSITLSGTGFKVATETLLFTQGPIRLKTVIEAHWAEAAPKLLELVRRVPRPFRFDIDQVESNVAFAADYQDRMGSVLAWMDDMFAPPLPGDLLTPTSIAVLHAKSPFGDPTSRALINTKVKALAGGRARANWYETGDLPIEPGSAYPPVTTGSDPNVNYGIHRTPAGAVEQGRRADAAIDSVLPARDLAVV